MKKLNRITFACLLATSIPVCAQKIPQMIDQSFDEFISALLKNDFITASRSDSYAEGYYKEYAFALPRKRSKDFDKFNENLKLNSREASSSLLKKAGSRAATKCRLTYGNYNAYSKEFGSNEEYNYNVQTFNKHAAQPGMRTAYALEWKNSKDSIFGTAYVIYGKDPDAKFSILPNSTGTGFIKGKDGATSTIGGKSFYASDPAGAIVVPTSSADFLQQFTSLSTLFTTNASDFSEFKKKWDSSSDYVSKRVALLSGAANRIMRLCKEYGKILDKGDREIVRNALPSLAGMCSGDLAYLTALFTSAQNALK